MSKYTEGAGTNGADEDRDLVLRSRQGDLDAFEQLVVKHQKKMLNLAYRMTGSYDDACDIVQDAFVAAFRQLGTFEGRAAFSTWLCTITINLSKNRLAQLKRERERQTVSLDAPLRAEEGRIAVDPPSGDPSALELLERREVQQGVRRCIDGLDEDFRSVVVLRDMQGFTYQEIGAMLGLAEGTVKSRIFRAREMLRNCLSKLLGAL